MNKEYEITIMLVCMFVMFAVMVFGVWPLYITLRCQKYVAFFVLFGEIRDCTFAPILPHARTHAHTRKRAHCRYSLIRSASSNLGGAGEGSSDANVIRLKEVLANPSEVCVCVCGMGGRG